MRHALPSPDLVRSQEHLGIRTTDKPFALGLQLLANFEIVIDLAVVRDDIAAVLVAHWLMPALGQINDGEPGMSKLNVRVGVYSRSIRTSMSQCGQILRRKKRSGSRLSIEPPKNAAHRNVWPFNAELA
jgi:hypothetical protein